MPKMSDEELSDLASRAHGQGQEGALEDAVKWLDENGYAPAARALDKQYRVSQKVVEAWPISKHGADEFYFCDGYWAIHIGDREIPVPIKLRHEAKLMAAAPRLYAALEALEPHLDHIPGGIGAEIDEVRDILAVLRRKRWYTRRRT